MDGITFQSMLAFANLILSSANAIVAFSLLVYIVTHNPRSAVARAFCALMALVTSVYVADLAIAEVETAQGAALWLRLQWLGIALMPAAYFHFSDALLRTTGFPSGRRRWIVMGGYLLGLATFLSAVLGEAIVTGITQRDGIYHLLPGPLFWPFAAYYAVLTAWGWFNVRRARSRSLTSTSRRRMSYLMLAIVAPVLGVFPYLLVPTAAHLLTPAVVMVLTLLGNLGIVLMTIVIAYIVAYQGVLLPDRVVKHGMIHFLLRGPLVAIAVIMLMLTIPRVEHILGLPRDTVMIVAVAGTVVLLQVLINVAKPTIDRLIYRHDRREIAWIQTLDQRLLTTTDLEQLLENTLVALCDFLRSPSGLVVTTNNGELSLRVFCGHRQTAEAFLAEASLPDLLEALRASRTSGALQPSDFVPSDGHWLLPLRSHDRAAILGILGIHGADTVPTYSEDDLSAVQALVYQAETALEDMQLQQQVFAVLQGLGPELDRLQELRSTQHYAGDATRAYLEASPAFPEGFSQAVKDALNHFWGGPKLTHSPLLNLNTVRQRLQENDGVPAKAVRAVLQEAIERLRPSGERSMTTSEWVMYNILDLRYVQGQRTRDVAQRLAMSESDYYRKQRLAIEQLSQTLIQMERISGQAERDAQPTGGGTEGPAIIGRGAADAQ
ncbi:MAG TPA: hypothetical protein GX714_00160 [Chloroflexi bacterium]|jgi:hypothetical protein|nr:hypothetical protein [Chloroflexota bacterium]